MADQVDVVSEGSPPSANKAWRQLADAPKGSDPVWLKADDAASRQESVPFCQPLRAELVHTQRRGVPLRENIPRRADTKAVGTNAAMLCRRTPVVALIAACLAIGGREVVSAEVPVAQEETMKAWIEVQAPGSWGQASLNRYEEVWTPASLRPLDVNGGGASPPSKIIGAWGGFAWDRSRGDLVLYGGGHADYPGNDIYRWRSTTRRWERASLPSEIRRDAAGNFVAKDGPDHAPASAHPYANNVFLHHLDRLLVLGGAAYNNGGAFMTATEGGRSRRTGPYVWNPKRADGNKVGGTNGSHVQRKAPLPDVLGGEMWQNRDLWRYQASSGELPNRHVDGCAAYVDEGGRDVVYVVASGGGGTSKQLYRYEITDLARPETDAWRKAGDSPNGPQGQTVCAIDPMRRVLVRLGGRSQPLMLWRLDAGRSTTSESGIDLAESGDAFASLREHVRNGTIDIKKCGLDFSPEIDRFAIWCGGAQVWLVAPPPTGLQGAWTIEPAPVPQGAVPSQELGVGVLGKWRYAPDLGVFIALQGGTSGHVWVYKPVAWRPPGRGVSRNP